MFPYKIIFSDLDMTLLNLKAKLSEANLSALSRALDRGVRICLVSGRSPSGIRLIGKQLPKPVSMAACNGAIVIDEAGSIVHSVALPNDVALSV
ncbi:HAD-IIB family hydrolase, partial [bacterium]|nr:HAD-IIB family hydrolase [bacterium]